MKRAGRLVIAAGAALLACACSSKGTTTVGGGNESGEARTCEGIRPKVERLYRAEAEAKEPKRVDEAVADNTKMVMNDCAKAPAKVAACVNGVSSVPDLEKKCLVPLDDEGTEGEALRR
jgi:hypothetical protein